MSKRYTFWRGPDGKAYRGVDGKYAPRELLAEWGRRSSLNAEKQISWNGFGPIEVETAVKMALSIVSPTGEELNAYDAWIIARQALIQECHANGGSAPIDNGQFLKRADAGAAAFFATSKKHYSLVTSLSVDTFPVTAVQICGCKIRPLASRKRYPLPKTVSDLSPTSILRNHIQQTRYKWVAIDVSGRTPNEAFSQAIDALGLLRTFWTLAATYGRWNMTWGSGPPKPLATVHTGPIQTLHTRSGAPINDHSYWHDTDPREDRSLFKPTGGWAGIEKSRRSMMRRLTKLPYRVDIEQILVRYISALDQIDHNVAFLQMWTILERITDTVGARYDDTIERSVWALKNRALGKQLLDCVRLQRNRYVHSSFTMDGADQAAHLVKSFLDTHLVALIFNSYKLKTLEEYAKVLALPVDVLALEALKNRAILALRMHKPKATATATP